METSTKHEINEFYGMTAVATPKHIRKLMKVDGLTNDEVKSHLQVSNSSQPSNLYQVKSIHFLLDVICKDALLPWFYDVDCSEVPTTKPKGV